MNVNQSTIALAQAPRLSMTIAMTVAMTVAMALTLAITPVSSSFANTPASANGQNNAATSTTKLSTKQQDPFANEADPFANETDPFANETDPFAEDSTTTSNSIFNTTQHRPRIELKSYYQNNTLRAPHALNPGIELFDQYQRFIGLDISLSSQWSDSISSHGRLFSRYIAGSDPDRGRAEPAKNRHSSNLLEGSLQWQNQAQDLAITIGRVKPTWSNGYNYDIANFLKPHGNLPYIDQDNPLQHKGWDMIQAQYFFDRFTLSGYLIESRLDSANTSNINHEGVIRLGYQDNHEFSLLIHKYDHGRASYAATFNTSINDNTTFRAEWTSEPQRRLFNINSVNNKIDQQRRYQRMVLGTTYTWLNSWSLSAEFFYNQHGATEQQWQNLYLASKLSAERVISGQSQDFGYDISNALSGINFLGQGWSAKRYGSLMLTSAQSTNLWQLRISTQINLVDSSQLYRVEVLKSLNDNLSARLEYQQFNGCSSCEYGLNPYDSNLRFTASWLF